MLKSNNFVQEQFAESIALQPQTIATIETGRSFVADDVPVDFCNYSNVKPMIFLSKNINYLSDKAVNYINEIKRILPLIQIFDIAKALNLTAKELFNSD